MSVLRVGLIILGLFALIPMTILFALFGFVAGLFFIVSSSFSSRWRNRAMSSSAATCRHFRARIRLRLLMITIPRSRAHKLRIAIGEPHETLKHLEGALDKKYITDNEHLEMFDLADRAIGAAVKFVEYLDAAGPDWKKETIWPDVEKPRAARREKQTNSAKPTDAGTQNPDENVEPQNPNPNENENPNENGNLNENKN